MPGKLGLCMPEGDARAMYVCTAGRKLGLRMPEGDARAMYVCMYGWGATEEAIALRMYRNGC